MSEYMNMIENALTDKNPLKLILKGWMEEEAGIVAVVYATTDSTKARNRIKELISAGNEGLTVAFDKYSPAKKVRFLTYAGAWVDQRITHHMSRMRIVSLPTYKQQICAKIDKVKAANPEASNEELRELLKEQGFTEKQIKELFDYRYLTYYISDIDEQNFLVNPIEESFEKQLDDERVWKAVSQLPSPSREIIARMYGLVDGEEQTAAAISKALRLTKEEITTHVENAMEILRDVFDA